MNTLPKSPAAIREIGNIVVKSAFEHVAKEFNVTEDDLKLLMVEDPRVANRVKDYITCGYNFAMSKL